MSRAIRGRRGGGARAREFGAAAGGSRLINGNLECHEALEQELAAFFEQPAALAFSTGYMANVGVIPALVGPGDVLVSDALNHASIIDGARLARCEVAVFRHGDVDAFADTLARVREKARRVLVAVDGVYSMDGDVLADRRDREARPRSRRDRAPRRRPRHRHPRPPRPRRRRSRGRIARSRRPDGHPRQILGSFGAFVAGSQRLRELLVNTARSFIFSRALAPASVEAARAALRLVEQEPWRRERLARNCDRLRAASRPMRSRPPRARPTSCPSSSARTRRRWPSASRSSPADIAQGIRHPSVPSGTARLRITPMATHQDDEIDGLADAIAEILAAQRAGGAGSAPGAALGAGGD
ncbi:MAG: aminotransferase class I/II-fold pyridoxal phosphate-dependent enzyme [Myxococcota bacterium]